MLSMVLYFFAGILPLGLITLLLGVELRFVFTVELRQLRLKAEVRLLFGALKYRFELIAAGLPSTLYFNGKGLKKRKKKLKQQSGHGMDFVRALWRGMRMEKLKAYGTAGVRGDACASVLLTGVLDGLLRALAALSGAQSVCVALAPALDCDMLCINLEGIAHINTVKTIGAALLRQIAKKRKGRKKNDASC